MKYPQTSIFNKSMYYTSKHLWLLCLEKWVIFFINLDRLRLKKTLSDLFFETFSCFQSRKIVENPFLPFIQPSTEGSVHKNFLLYFGGAFISNVEDIGKFIFWIKTKKKIGLVSLVRDRFNFKKWQKTNHKKKSRLPLNCWRDCYPLNLQLHEYAHPRYHQNKLWKIHTKFYLNEWKISKKLGIHIL